MEFNLNQYYIELGGVMDGFFKRNIFIQYDDDMQQKRDAFVRRCKNTDVFQCVYMYDTKDIDEANLYGPLYLDMDGDSKYNIDTEKGFQGIKPIVQRSVLFFKGLGFTDNDINLYFSGSKGFHLTIDPRVLGIIPSKDLNALYKAWALHIHNTYRVSVIDLRIYDKRRLFRLPNSINSKTGLYKVQISSYDLYHMSLQDLKQYASEPHSIDEAKISINKSGAIAFYKKNLLYKKRQRQIENKRTGVQSIDINDREILPCIQSILENGSIKGARNNTLIVLSSSLFQLGKTIDEVKDTVEQWNKLNEPPLDERELLNTVRSAYSMHKNGWRYGCSSIKEMGLCSDNECRVDVIRNG